MGHTVAAVAPPPPPPLLFLLLLLLLSSVAQGWAPKKHTPVDLTSMRPSSTRGRSAGAGTPIEQSRRRQLQAYDLTEQEVLAGAGKHWDTSRGGLSGYDFDPPTHQGGEMERFGFAPLPQVATRDPNAPPTAAEMYPLLLNKSPVEQMAELAKDYRRRKAGHEGAYSLEWCERTAIPPGQSGCSSIASLRTEDTDDGSADDARWQALRDAAWALLGGTDEPIDGTDEPIDGTDP